MSTSGTVIQPILSPAYSSAIFVKGLMIWSAATYVVVKTANARHRICLFNCLTADLVDWLLGIQGVPVLGAAKTPPGAPRQSESSRPSKIT